VSWKENSSDGARLAHQTADVARRPRRAQLPARPHHGGDARRLRAAERAIRPQRRRGSRRDRSHHARERRRDDRRPAVSPAQCGRRSVAGAVVLPRWRLRDRRRCLLRWADAVSRERGPHRRALRRLSSGAGGSLAARVRGRVRCARLGTAERKRPRPRSRAHRRGRRQCGRYARMQNPEGSRGPRSRS
jgi:hypothetical protein